MPTIVVGINWEIQCAAEKVWILKGLHTWENVVGVEEGYVLCTIYLSVVVDEEFGTEEIIKLSLGLAFAGRGIGSQLQNARVALR